MDTGIYKNTVSKKIYHFQMNFTDLAIFLAYIKSDEQFYHINPKEKLNFSECLKYCDALDASLPAYNEKSLIQKFILDVKYGSEFMHRFTDPWVKDPSKSSKP